MAALENAVLRAHGDDAAAVEPDALEDELQKVALRLRILFLAPEDREVVEHALGLAEVGQRLGGEPGQLGLDRLAAGEGVGAGELDELTEVSDAAQGLLERCPASRPFGAVVEAGAGEPAQDLLAHGLLTRRIRAAAPGS